MKAFFLLRYYQLRHGLKGLLLSIGLLVALFLAFQVIFIDNSQLTSVPVALVDMDHTESSARVVASILEKTVLKVELVDEASASVHLKNHKIEAVVLIKPGFEEALSRGQYEKLIDMTYLDRSTSAPALTDVLAGAVLKEACAYNAILQVKKYDDSPEALSEITRLVKESIKSQEYSVPLDLEIKSPAFINQEASQVSFNAQLPKRLAVGYTLFVALLITSLYGGQLANELFSVVTQRVRVSEHSLTTYIFTSVLLAVGFFVLFFGGIIGLFIGYPVLLQSGGLFALAFHLGVTLATWLLLILILSIFFKSRNGFYTLMMPLVVLTGLISGCFWPLDFISRSLMKPIAYLPSYQFILTLEDLLIGQSIPAVEMTQFLVLPIAICLILIVTTRVIILNKSN